MTRLSDALAHLVKGIVDHPEDVAVASAGSSRGWAEVAPRQVRLDQLVTTRRQLDLDALLSEDSTFYGDLFAHVVMWGGELFLEDGLHRAVRAALQQRTVLHARVLDLD